MIKDRKKYAVTPPVIVFAVPLTDYIINHCLLIM